jgi:hypothetical protein
MYISAYPVRSIIKKALVMPSQVIGINLKHHYVPISFNDTQIVLVLGAFNE